MHLGSIDICGQGYTFTKDALNGKEELITYPLDGIINCQKECDSREGCTGFQYTNDNGKNYNCSVYIGLDKDNHDHIHKSNWKSCAKGINIIVFWE